MLSSAENMVLSPPVLKRKRSEATYSDYFLPSAKALPSLLLLPALTDDLGNFPSLQQIDEDLPPTTFLQPRPRLSRDLDQKRKTLSPISNYSSQPIGLTFIDGDIVLKKRRSSLLATTPAMEKGFTRRSSWASCA
jgi:hypothetical protein